MYHRLIEERLDVAVIGCGSAGPATALFLQRGGHRVELFERVPELGPVGAGFLLQPTGLDVLAELGLLDAVIAGGTPVERLYCHTRRGRTILDLHYAELGDGLCGLGVHRASFLDALMDGVRSAGISLRLGCDIESMDPARGELRDCGGQRHGPFDLIVVADGARSGLRDVAAPKHRVRPYRWGALWLIAEDPGDDFGGVLHQVVEGSRRMIGLLPSGRANHSPSLVSLFWSLAVDRAGELRAAGIDALKAEMLRLAPHAEPIIAAIEDFESLTLASYVDVIMRPRWHIGRVLFIGDAAHATSPQLGQGVNLALCDARELARCLADSSTLEAALDLYAERRRHHLRYYQWSSRWLTPFFQSSSRALGLVRDLGFPVLTWLGPTRRLMTRTMCGVKRGFLRPSMPMPSRWLLTAPQRSPARTPDTPPPP